MNARTLYIIIASLLLTTLPAQADNEVTGPDMSWEGDSDDDDFGDDSPAAVQSPSDNTANDAYYDLQGKRVTTLTPGRIYIHKGKKILFKSK